MDDAGKRTHTYANGPTGLPLGTTTEAVSQPYRYSGTYLDPTGLCKMGHRYYDAQLGRFTQPDLSGQETNPYPSGLLCDSSLGSALGGTLCASKRSSQLASLRKQMRVQAMPVKARKCSALRS
ncbi:RHS repeat-associated core domain-containing protein [Streptomyces sp. NPDC002779]|uniref:RHS repeat-associated core domain-containing protein n=1 Tax=Streptomyces sp. NPDC002779 TaxID=3364664 RepID=UPI003674547D